MANSNPTNEAGKLLYYPIQPEHLQDHNAFLKMSCHTYDMRLYGNSMRMFFKDQSRSISEEEMLKNPVAHIFLPIPNGGLGTNDNLIYNESKGGVTMATKGATILLDTIRKSIPVVSSFVSAYEEVGETALGRVANQFLVHTFKGIALREYTYTWSFIPYSQEDANALNNIIKQIRKSSLSKYDPDNYTIKYPDFWTVEPIVNDKLLFKLNYLVISNIKINYGREGEVTFFHDGNPTEMSLSITFKEVYPQGSEMYNNQNDSRI